MSIDFGDDEHALITGLVYGALKNAGVNVEVLLNTAGEPTDVLLIRTDVADIRIRVLPPT